MAPRSKFRRKRNEFWAPQESRVSLKLICTCGGIGRRARFRIWYLTMCRFKSCQVHHERLVFWQVFYCFGLEPAHQQNTATDTCTVAERKNIWSDSQHNGLRYASITEYDLTKVLSGAPRKTCLLAGLLLLRT